MPTKIPWARETWNPVTGCRPVSAGCQHCYAAANAKRFWGTRPFSDVRCHEDRLEIPLHWKKPRRVFIPSMGDLFHPDVPLAFVNQVLEMVAICPQHTFMLLTKRPRRMKSVLCSGTEDQPPWALSDEECLPNLWLGVTIENQAALWRLSPLIQIPAAKRFISAEPLLEEIDFGFAGICPKAWGKGYSPIGNHIDLLIAGCESGSGRRPMDIAWVRSLRDQCVDAGVAFFLKQAAWRGKVVEMPLLDGEIWDQLPGGWDP